MLLVNIHSFSAHRGFCFSVLNASEQCKLRSAFTSPGWEDSIPYCSVAKLIVGTLYCAEKAYDYGVRTVLEALYPLERALNQDTW